MAGIESRNNWDRYFYHRKAGNVEIIISEELEQERTKKYKKFEPMSDERGNYEEQQLRKLLGGYLRGKNVTNQRIRDVVLPALLEQGTLTREELKRKILVVEPNADESRVGYYLTAVSSQLGMKKNDFLRQVIDYKKPRYGWEKDNFSLRDEYKDLVKQVLDEIKNTRP